MCDPTDDDDEVVGTTASAANKSTGGLLLIKPKSSIEELLTEPELPCGLARPLRSDLFPSSRPVGDSAKGGLRLKVAGISLETPFLGTSLELEAFGEAAEVVLAFGPVFERTMPASYADAGKYYLTRSV